MLGREQHGEARAGRITSSVAGLLLTGSKASWEKLARHLDVPPPFHEARGGALLEGVKNEPIIARRFLQRHPEVTALTNPTLVYHHDPKHPHFDLIASSPDRMADGIPVEIKHATKAERFTKLTRHFNNRAVPGEHLSQVTWHAWMTGTNRCWFVVATQKQYAEILWQRDDLSFVDELLERFIQQYRTFSITGARPCLQ